MPSGRRSGPLLESRALQRRTGAHYVMVADQQYLFSDKNADRFVLLIEESMGRHSTGQTWKRNGPSLVVLLRRKFALCLLSRVLSYGFLPLHNCNVILTIV